MPKKPAGALQLFRQASDAGLANAKAQIGFAYEHGEGVPQNWTEAAKWRNASARQFDKLRVPSNCVGYLARFILDHTRRRAVVAETSPRFRG